MACPKCNGNNVRQRGKTKVYPRGNMTFEADDISKSPVPVKYQTERKMACEDCGHQWTDIATGDSRDLVY